MDNLFDSFPVLQPPGLTKSVQQPPNQTYSGGLLPYVGQGTPQAVQPPAYSPPVMPAPMPMQDPQQQTSPQPGQPQTAEMPNEKTPLAPDASGNLKPVMNQSPGAVGGGENPFAALLGKAGIPQQALDAVSGATKSWAQPSADWGRTWMGGS